jgi:hypothetical protein
MPTGVLKQSRGGRGSRSPGAQLALCLDGLSTHWRYSRPVRQSRHFGRIRERLEFVRSFFPELDGICVRVGLARSRQVLGSCSLDPEDPAVWVRPRLVDAFTVAHEFTHLLQARGQVPGGERACDLFALGRSPLLIDSAPTYLEVPDELREAPALDTGTRMMLHEIAAQALARRRAGHRYYLRYFEETFRRQYASGPGLGFRH